MSIWGGLNPQETQRTLESERISLEGIDPIVLDEDRVGVGEALVRGPLSASVRVGSLFDMAAGGLAVGLDKLSGTTELQDQVFAEHEATFGRTKQILTPQPQEVTTAGQIAFVLSQGLTELAAGGPRTLVATEQLNTAEDFTRGGVDSTTAQAAGAITGVANAIGAALPAGVGGTLGKKVASGVGINVVAGGLTDAGQNVLLEQRGYGELAAGFDPFDLKARSVDAVMGAAFGGLAHLGAPTALPREKNAAATLNLASQMEQAAPGRPVDVADATAHANAFEKAQDDLMSDQPVDVSRELDGAAFTPDPRRQQQMETVASMADEAVAEVRLTDPERFLTPDELTSQRHEREVMNVARELGIPEEQARALAGKTTPEALRDNVTGLYEARVGEGENNLRLDAIARAQRINDETGAPATYVHADLANLGGLNSALTESGANEVFRFAASAFREELAKIGAEVRSLAFRHGGDEISGVVLNATEEQAANALRMASERLQAMANQMTTPEGLRVSEIEHPKHPGVAEKRGTGLSYGTSPIQAGADRGSIIKHAETQLEAMKKEVTKNVPRNTTGQPGADAPGGQAGRTAGGPGEAGSGTARPDAAAARSASGQEGSVEAEQLKAAEQAILENPSIPAIDESTGELLPAGDLLARIDTEITEAQRKAETFAAAAACFLRNGGL